METEVPHTKIQTQLSSHCRAHYVSTSIGIYCSGVAGNYSFERAVVIKWFWDKCSVVCFSFIFSSENFASCLGSLRLCWYQPCLFSKINFPWASAMLREYCSVRWNGINSMVNEEGSGLKKKLFLGASRWVSEEILGWREMLVGRAGRYGGLASLWDVPLGDSA